MKKIFATLIILLISSQAFSDYTWHSSEIRRIYPQANGSFIVTFVNPSPDCSRSDNYHYISTDAGGVTQEGINSMLSVVLSAAAMGKVVNAYFDRDSNTCPISRLHVEF